MIVLKFLSLAGLVSHLLDERAAWGVKNQRVDATMPGQLLRRRRDPDPDAGPRDEL